MHNQKYLDTNKDVNLILLQIRSTSIGTGVPSPATLLLNRPIQSQLPQMNREPININNDDAKYEALKAHQDKYVKNSDTHKDLLSFPIMSTVATHCEDGGPWMHGLIKEANSSGHKGRCYIIRVTKWVD